MATNPWFWILFNLFVLAMLALDLGIFNRKAHRIGVKEAAIWSVVWTRNTNLIVTGSVDETVKVAVGRRRGGWGLPRCFCGS